MMYLEPYQSLEAALSSEDYCTRETLKMIIRTKSLLKYQSALYTAVLSSAGAPWNFCNIK